MVLIWKIKVCITKDLYKSRYEQSKEFENIVVLISLLKNSANKILNN